MSSHANAVKQAALDIVSKLPGSRVFPVPALTKKPTMKDWQLRATDDPAKIESWFSDDNLNIGLVPGDLFGVLDIEGPNKGLDKGAPGHVSLAEMEAKFGKLPPTLTARTPSGGEHRFFRVPHAMAMQPQAAGFVNVEFRTGHGCNVLVAPSRTDVGGYVWVDYNAPIVDLPSAWVEALDAFKPRSSVRASTPNTSLAAALKEQRETRFAKLKTRKEPQLESILRGCAWMRDFVNNQETQTEPEWYAALSIVGRCEDGEKLAHLCSNGHPKYDHGETEEKRKQALSESGPRTCANINSALCEGCIFAHHGEGWSLLTLGYDSPEMVDVLSGAVYATDDGVFLRPEDGVRVPAAIFAAGVQHKIKHNPRDKLLASSALVRVKKLDYVVGEGGAGNLWRWDGILPKEGDCSAILGFLTYLFPVERERGYILDYIAHLVQKPGVKIKYGVMLSGVQGNGKSTFAHLLCRMFGRNARTVNGVELHSRFKCRFVDCQLLHIEEAHHGGKLEAYNELKQLMTDEYFPVEEKGVPRWEGRTPRGVVMCTNDESGVVIPNGDRRWLIASTVSEKKDSAYFRELNAAIGEDDVIAAFAHQLGGRDISRFQPGAEPPMTDAKRLAMEATATPLAQVLRMIREEGVQPWTRKTFATMDEVMSSLRRGEFDVGGLTPSKVGKALRDIGAVRSKQIRLGSTKIRLWVMDGDPKWATASEAEIRAEYERDRAASFDSSKILSMPLAIQEAVMATSRGEG